MASDVESFVRDQIGRVGRAQVRDAPKRLAAEIRDGEQVINAAACKLDGKVGLLAVTDRRVIVMTQGVTSKAHEEYPLPAITAVRAERGKGTGEITLIVGSREVEIDNVNPVDRYEEIAPWLRQHVGAASSPAPTADPAAQLTQLKSLLDSGILTQEEFDAKKGELLARM